MRLNKKGQVTPFIIVGIIIVIVAVILIVFMRPDISRLRVTSTAQTDTVRDYVEECIRQEGKEALDLIAEHGGFVEENPIVLGNENIFVHYKDEEGLFGEEDVLHFVKFWLLSNGNRPMIRPTLVEIEINNFVNKEIEDCLNSLTSFPNVETEVVNRELKTTIGNYNTIITLDLPITFKKGEVKIERFSYTFNYALGEFLNIADYFVTEKGKYSPFANDYDKNSDDIEVDIEGWPIYDGKLYINRELDNQNEIFILQLNDEDKVDINYKFQFALQNSLSVL